MQIEIYKTTDNTVELNVNFDNETVWLNRQQLSSLFCRDIKTIGKHINNVFEEGELDKFRTVAKFATVQKEGKREIERNIEYYNLDVIISVGYRVKSKHGTQFRQWATQRLKDYLAKGYAINQKRLDELGKMVQLIEQSGKADNLQLQEAKGLLEILGNYTKSFVLLNQYDSHAVTTKNLSAHITYEIQYDEAKTAITELKKQLIAQKEATNLFGNEKDKSFKSSLLSIVQTFDGNYLYPSIEEQAANLLYFIIKNHSFSDGNKRIGAFLFIWFLEKNKHRFKKSGELKINDNGLTALALLVAQSNPSEKELMIKLIINLINE
ncbi:MAG: virulence protein RhuM/Fic/DOC family protein [Bacteroidetes bacterium]|nr:virulence protein RhuM/Fic/DOC family protein [Bacteroidota bacterium]